MRLLWRRPLFCCCLFAILAATLSVFGFLQGLRPYLWALFALPVPILIILFRKNLRRALIPVLCCLMTCLLLLSAHVCFDLSSDFAKDLSGMDCRISGYVTDRRTDGESYYLTITNLDGKRVRVKAALNCAFSAGLQPGDHIEAVARGADFETTEFQEDEQELLSDGVRALFVCEDYDLLSVSKESGFHPILAFRKLNHSLASRLRLAVGGEAGNIAAALLLGNKSGLSGDTKLSFRRAGVSHLLALSGLHVSILIGALELLFRKILASKRLRMLLCALCLLFYLALTGFHASTVRAVLLVFSVYFAFLVWEEPDPITSLGTILYLTLFILPYSIYDLSLWMSYLATFGILIFAPLTLKLSRRLGEHLPRALAKALGYLLGLLLTGCAANGALLLLMSLVFGELSVASIPATILLSIPTTVTMISSILTLIFPALGFLPRFSAEAMLDLSNFFSDSPNVLLSMRSPILLLLLVLFTILLLLLAVLRIKRPILFLAIPLAMLLVFGLSFGLSQSNSASHLTEDYALEINAGEVFLLCSDSTERSVASEVKLAVSGAGATKIDHIYLTEYATLQPVFLARLATSVRVFYLHLPQPKTDTELAMALRLEEEAALHRIYVIYDAPY